MNFVRVEPSSIPSRSVRLMLKQYDVPGFGSSVMRSAPRTLAKAIEKEMVRKYRNVQTPQTSLSEPEEPQVEFKVPAREVRPKMIVAPHLSNLIGLWEDREANQRKQQAKQEEAKFSRQQYVAIKKEHLQRRIMAVQERKESQFQMQLAHHADQVQLKGLKVLPPRRVKESACFSTTTRQYEQRKGMRARSLLGPGHYDMPVQFRQTRRQAPPNQREDNKNLSQNKLVRIIKQVVQGEQVEQVEEQGPQESREKQGERNWPQFKQLDHDRFGEQLYPLVVRNDGPGPGKYQLSHTIESKFIKAKQHQLQKLALKKWFQPA